MDRRSGRRRSRPCRRDRDLIYAWMQPYISAHSAARLSEETGLPWVADLGDPWALDEMMVYPTRLHRRRELRLMRRLLGTASAIVMSTAEAASQLVERIPELAVDAGRRDPEWVRRCRLRGADRSRDRTTSSASSTRATCTRSSARQQRRGGARSPMRSAARSTTSTSTRGRTSILLQAVERLRGDRSRARSLDRDPPGRRAHRQ